MQLLQTAKWQPHYETLQRHGQKSQGAPAGGDSANGTLTPEVWTSVEGVNGKMSQGKCIACFNSSQLVRGFHVIECGIQRVSRFVLR